MNQELQNLLLENRGIAEPEEKEKFLNPSYDKDIYDPYLMKNMEKAVVRIFEAIEAKEKIIIYSDYDCDGIPGAVMLNDLFSAIGGPASLGRPGTGKAGGKKIGYQNFEIYIPDRQAEGYGLNHEAVNQFIKSGTKLLITVDLGITDVEEIANAQANGIDVIVTDHHLPPIVLPQCYTILNPKQVNDKYPEKMLCGAGVAFKLVQAFLQKYGEYFGVSQGFEKWLLDMVGIATLSDQVPLLGENRVLAVYGLKVLQKNRRIGLQKLWSEMKIDARYLTEDDITFMLAPRLNAASRMASPRLAFEALASEDEGEAGSLAQELVKINKERKVLVSSISKEIKKTMEKREVRDVIVIGSPRWRPGILGLVAAKLVEEYNRPVFVWGKEGGDCIKGSCRSVEGVNLVEVMRCLPEGSMLDFGGHEMAGGFSISGEQIHFLEEKLAEAYGKYSKYSEDSKDSLPSEARAKWNECKIDKKMSLEDVTMANYKQIEELAPFGVGNPKPAFLFERVAVSEIKKFGKNKEHLEIVFTDQSGAKVKAIQFFKDVDSFNTPIEIGKIINLVANFELNRYGWKEELRLRIVNIY